MSNGAEKAKAQSIVREQTGEVDLLSKILEEGRLVRHEGQEQQAKDMIAEFVQQVMQGQVVMGRDIEATIKARIAQIDHLLSVQLNEIMHAEPFQKLEASWRGLHYLVDESETRAMLKIRVLNVSKKDLLNDLERAAEFDQTALFKKVYEEEYGTFGGQPFGALIGDYEFAEPPAGHGPAREDVQVAAAAHAPFIAAHGARALRLGELPRPDRAPRPGEDLRPDRVRQVEVLPRIGGLALRRPHAAAHPDAPALRPGDGARSRRSTSRRTSTGRTTTSTCGATRPTRFGTRLTDAFAQYGWCAAIRGVEGGGLVEGLPAHTFQTDDGDVALKCPTEIAITDRREKELSDLGFIPLVHCKGTDYAAFFGAQSAQKAKMYDTRGGQRQRPPVDAAAATSSRSSRFAHYLKAMMRDKIGSFMSRKDCETFLNQLDHEVRHAGRHASQESKAKYPLREARIDVAEVPGKPGAYRAVAFLRPHFQLDELTVSLRLVAELPSSARK